MTWENGGPQCQTENWRRMSNDNLDPTHQHIDGSWWFYDETWVQEYGPFDTKESADASCIRYASECL